MNELTLHEKQAKAFESDAKVTLVCSGIQGGKTTVGALWLLRQLLKHKGKDNTFIIGAPTFKILNQSTMPTFLKYASAFGTYHKADQEFHFKSGAIAYIRTSTDPESVEGIQNVRAIWCDEAGKCKHRFWVNLEGRAARTNAPILCTTTPYALNWPYREIIKPFKRGERSDVCYQQWTSKDNPSFPIEHYERQKKLLDHVTFQMKYAGEHMKKVGLVFPLEEGQAINPFELPSGTKYYAAIDWGFVNPMAFIIRGLTPEGRDIQVKEFYESGVYPDDIPFIVRQAHERYNLQAIVADPSDAGKIAMLQRVKIPVIPADNDIQTGIDAHIKLIRSGKYYIFNTCKHTLDEYETYSYKEEDEEKMDAKREEPVAKSNHAMDANRYLSLYLVKSNIHAFDRSRVHHIELTKRSEVSPTTHQAPWKRKKESNESPDFY